MAETLLRDQKTTGKLLSRFTVNTEKLGESALTLDVVQTRLTLLEKYWGETLQRHMKLQSFETTDADDDFTQDLFTDYEMAYSLAKSKHRTCIAAFVEQAQAQGRHDESLREASVQIQSTTSSLPKLKLPTFSGKQEEWDTFKEVFSSMVKDTSTLTPVLKLQHLSSCLEGEAARRLANFEVIGSNFDVAWTALCRRYDNKRLRQAVQLLKILDMAPVVHRSPGEDTRLLDTTSQCIRGLKKLGRLTEYWDGWIVHVIVFKLDQQTREDWEKSLEGSEEYSTYDQLATFLEYRVRSLDNAHCNSFKTNGAQVKGSSKVKYSPQDKSRSLTAHHTMATSTGVTPAVATNGQGQDRRTRDPCPVCKGAHTVAQCPTYLQATSTHRRSVVDQLHLCRNCLRTSHRASSCPSKYRCRLCQQGHHTTLHVQLPPGEFLPPGPRPPLAAAPTGALEQQGPQAYVSRVGSPILLGTARVVFESPAGLQHEARVLIDPASQGHMLTERITQMLRLKKTIIPTNVQGIGGVTAKSSSVTTAVVRSLTQPTFVVSFSALVLPKFTSHLPSTRVEHQSWPHLQDLQLADPEFHHPAEVDGILGADIYTLIIEAGQRHGDMGTPVGQLTKLG